MKKPGLSDKRQLLKILDKHSLIRKRVVLSSGKVSNYYFDARISSLHSKGSYLIASVILNMIKKDEIDAVGGLTLGADPIIGAVVALSHQKKQSINGFIVRKETKKHGMQNLIEGTPLKKSDRILIVDDVVTSGSSTIKAIEAVKKIGCKIVRVIAVVDRLSGAAENIEKCGCKLDSIFTIKDFNL
ncbi:MAG: orotate phosphoribosyltransferase [Candidatus Omnitrophota bacterium]